MKQGDAQSRKAVLAELDAAIRRAVACFRELPEDFFDGSMTAREIVAHLLFWHEEYLEITTALLNGRDPDLREGAFAKLNADAACKFKQVAYTQMLQRLRATQQELVVELRQLPDWTVSFPIKKGVRRQTVPERLDQIIDHIDRHVQRAERAQRRGEDWIRAYHSEMS